MTGNVFFNKNSMNMKIKKLIFPTVIFLLFSSEFGCRSSETVTEEKNPGYLQTENILRSDSSVYGDFFDWHDKSPADFLNMLKKRTAQHPFSVSGVHVNWIKASDIPGLIELLDSSEPCAPVNRAVSSYAELNGSTIGEEAAFLIIGFKKGEYPPSLNSTRPRLNHRVKDELKKWWQEFE